MSRNLQHKFLGFTSFDGAALARAVVFCGRPQGRMRKSLSEHLARLA
ncbi:hypothetical protein G4G28_10805 [Massilia sp. Dwa41.01b]|nr:MULTISPECIES: hypothetical protein [unclassified Massilia]QNA88851.1 hypothetical protein G4G28_10805 [Massilia sp. Dwa41.01b]QNA99740.1 hypothetical protein G4G31_14435 [Massilia sp. Se16.2.3]